MALGRAESSEAILAGDVALGHLPAAPNIRTSRAEAAFGANQRQWAQGSAVAQVGRIKETSTS